jgi:hypothetical protein
VTPRDSAHHHAGSPFDGLGRLASLGSMRTVAWWCFATTRAQASSGTGNDILLVVIGVAGLAGTCYLVARPWMGYRWFFQLDRQYRDVRALPEREAYTSFARVLFIMQAVFMVLFVALAIAHLIDPDLLRSR